MCEVSFITNWKAFAEHWIWIISNKLQLNIKHKKTKQGGKGREKRTEKKKDKEWERIRKRKIYCFIGKVYKSLKE